jgi:hypothetical protein
MDQSYQTKVEEMRRKTAEALEAKLATNKSQTIQTLIELDSI